LSLLNGSTGGRPVSDLLKESQPIFESPLISSFGFAQA